VSSAAPGCVVRVRYFAGARAAAGTSAETITLPGGFTVSDAIRTLAQRHGERLSAVLGAASFLLDGVAVRDTSISLPANAELDILPPFAGG
jgi:molybdopterin synthase sulfur carrier subunit